MNKSTKTATQDAAIKSDAIKVYKGFDSDWKCRDYQFAVGKTYIHDGEVELCASGFHACEYPLDIFNYYPPTGQMAECELSGVVDKKDGDSKRAGKSITIKASISIPMLISAAIEYTTRFCAPADAKHSTGYRSASSATGDRSASSATGYRSASSATGYRSASSATGDQSASSATGDQSASSATGYRSASSATGDQSASSATGYRSASSATGYRSASSATGDQSASSATGDQSASSATGDNAIAAAFGLASKSKAGKTGIVLVAWWDGKRKRIATGYVGENGIEKDTWYRADDAGQLIADRIAA